MKKYSMNNQGSVFQGVFAVALVAASIAVLLLFDASCLNASETDEDFAAAVDVLVRRLDSPIRHERDDSERALLEKGPGILPLLPTDIMLISSEVRLRLDRIRRTLENDVFLDLQTSLPISLFEGETTVGRIVEELTLQSGNRVESTEELSGRVIEWTNPTPLPFWPTIDRISALSESRFEKLPFGSSDDQGLLFTAIDPASEQTPDTTSAQVEYHGPFRVAFRPNWPENASVESKPFQLSTSLWWEPRLRVVRLDVPHATYGGRHANGAQFQPRTPDAVLEIPVDGKAVSRNWTIGMEVDENMSSDVVGETTRFAAQFEAIVLGSDHEFVFEEAGRYPHAQTFGDVTVVLEQVRGTSSTWEFDVRVSYEDGHGAFASHYSWYYANQAALLNRGGDIVSNVGVSNSMMRQQDEDGFVMTYVFRKPLDKQVDLKEISFSYVAPAFLRPLGVGSER